MIDAGSLLSPVRNLFRMRSDLSEASRVIAEGWAGVWEGETKGSEAERRRKLLVSSYQEEQVGLSSCLSLLGTETGTDAC